MTFISHANYPEMHLSSLVYVARNAPLISNMFFTQCTSLTKYMFNAMHLSHLAYVFHAMHLPYLVYVARKVTLILYVIYHAMHLPYQVYVARNAPLAGCRRASAKLASAVYSIKKIKIIKIHYYCNNEKVMRTRHEIE